MTAANDPFAEDLSAGVTGGHSSNPVSNLIARLRGNAGDDPATPTGHQHSLEFPSHGGSGVYHSRTNSRGGAHPRTGSEDIDDHMEGSVHLGTDVCTSCGFVRMSSVYCSVSQLHHGTDLPAETPKRKKGSLFSRIRDSMSGLTPMGGADDEAPGESSPAHGSGAADNAVLPSPSRGGLFAKSKESKQLAELLNQEEKERKKILEVVKLSAHEIDRQLCSVHKDVREVLRSQERERNIVAYDYKLEFDKFYAARKTELEDIKKEFALEAKLIYKKEKERRKHHSDAPEAEGQPSRAVDLVSPVPA